MTIIERQVANCIQISRRYLGFLRKEGNEAVPTGVHQLMNDLEHLVRVHPSVQENEFKVTLPVEDVCVKINGTDVIQVLLNLAVNAFQCSSQPHRVTIEGEVLHIPLDLTNFKDGETDRFLNVESMNNTAPLIKFQVRDDGPGIPAEVLPKIFQTYFTTKGPRHGTGLGLSIVQRLVKDGEGALQVHTKPGEGTTFTVYLPAVTPSKLMPLSS